MGRTTVRGINVDHWQSCMFWDILFSNFTLDYYFTGKYHWGKLDTLKIAIIIFLQIVSKYIYATLKSQLELDLSTLVGGRMIWPFGFAKITCIDS